MAYTSGPINSNPTVAQQLSQYHSVSSLVNALQVPTEEGPIGSPMTYTYSNFSVVRESSSVYWAGVPGTLIHY